jgi:CRISPR/Cas system CMR subunit Cmr6 (Cas7 group RAMP superfamily)
LETQEDRRDRQIDKGEWTDEQEKKYHEKLSQLKNEGNVLKKWEYKSNLLKSLKEEIEEDKLFLKDTEDVITRLKIRQNFLLG